MSTTLAISTEKLNQIISFFFGKEIIFDWIQIEAGHINSTYKVEMKGDRAGDKFLLQRLNTEVFKQPINVMENIRQCAAFLSQQSDYPYEILSPVSGQAGQWYFTHQDEFWRMFRFIDHTVSLDKVTEPKEAFMIAQGFGQFLTHINRDDVSKYHITIPDFHNFTQRYLAFSEYVNTISTDELDEQVQFLLEKIHTMAPSYIALENQNFPIRLVHHDTKANNILLDQDTLRPKCIIDLDTLMPGCIFSDFGDLIRTVLNPFEEDGFLDPEVQIDPDLFENLKNGFLSTVGQWITDQEKTYLIKGGKKIILLQIVRFLEDHLRGDHYYHVSYRGHNLKRALSQYNLLSAINQL